MSVLPLKADICQRKWLQKGRWRRDEQVVVAVFSFRTKEQLTKQRIKEEVVRVKRAMY